MTFLRAVICFKTTVSIAQFIDVLPFQEQTNCGDGQLEGPIDDDAMEKPGKRGGESTSLIGRRISNLKLCWEEGVLQIKSGVSGGVSSATHLVALSIIFKHQESVLPSLN